MPAAEVDVTPELIRGLLVEQFPDLGGLPVLEIANGWDNVMFRLGDDLAVRAPRRNAAATLIDHEQSVLGELGTRLPLAVPVPVRAGRPSVALGYPWNWSVTPWLPGNMVADTVLASPPADARRLGGFLAALHVPDDGAAPSNPYRGGFIGDNLEVNAERTAAVARGDELLVRFRELIDVAPWDHPPVWVHGDLHAANMLAHDVGGGMRISAVIDWGDVCAGDPATDLSVAWSLFDADDRSVLRAAASASEFGIDDATWQRAQAWAVHFAIMYELHSADNPTMAAIGSRLVASLLDG